MRLSLRLFSRLFSACLLLGMLAEARGELLLPSVIGDGMVLQRDKPVVIWGWENSGSTVSVAFKDQTRSAVADAAGNWQVTLDPMAASEEPAEMVVTASRAGAGELRVTDILIGDLWLCSGQSNMAMTLAQSADGPRHVAAANDPLIRLFAVPRTTALAPLATTGGAWKAASPQSAARFSAVAFFFGKRLREELQVPIGLIESAWGGTGAESWISAEGLAAASVLSGKVAELAADTAKARSLPESLHLRDDDWMEPALNDGDWEPIKLPLFWDYVFHPMQYDGVVWARKRIEVPEGWTGKPAILSLAVDDYETTWFNGVEIGRTIRHSQAVRHYAIPADLMKGGRAVIAVRTVKIGWGGIMGSPNNLKLRLAEDESQTISLAGEWLYKSSELKLQGLSPRVATSLYNGMIAPLQPYTLRGVIWYQGEANANPDTSMTYREIFPALIADWRSGWGEELPFYFVQLAAFRTNLADHWPRLRESQLHSLRVPGTGMAVAIDIGDPGDIHPKNKEAVGERLALWALAQTYGREIVHSGPLYAGMAIEDGAIRIHFTHAGDGLRARGDGSLVGFEIAGSDRRFVPAAAVIDGATILVSSPEVSEPTAVRYAWKDYPEGCSLTNSADLPASPFRTDSW